MHPSPFDTSPYMDLALAEAARALARGEVPVGCVIVDSVAETVIAAAGNRVEELGDPTAHAEMLAIREAARRLGTRHLGTCDLYVTLEPCTMCAAAISFARLRRVCFGAYDAKMGGVDHGARVFARETCHHRPEVVGGIGERAAGTLMRQFFATKR